MARHSWSYEVVVCHHSGSGPIWLDESQVVAKCSLDPVSTDGRVSLPSICIEVNGLCFMLRLSSWILVSFLIASLMSPQVFGQQTDSSVPSHEVDGSFVKEWLILGPVPFSNQDLDLLREVGGESNVRPKEGDVVQTSDGVRLTWRRVRSRTDMISMKQVIDINDGFVAYAYCELSSPESIESDLRVYSSEDVSVWLNGEETGQVSIDREFTMDFPPTVPISINPGRNSCLLKFEQHMPELILMVQALPAERQHLKLRIRDDSGSQEYRIGTIVNQELGKGLTGTFGVIYRELNFSNLALGNNQIWTSRMRLQQQLSDTVSVGVTYQHEDWLSSIDGGSFVENLVILSVVKQL